MLMPQIFQRSSIAAVVNFMCVSLQAIAVVVNFMCVSIQAVKSRDLDI